MTRWLRLVFAWLALALARWRCRRGGHLWRSAGRVRGVHRCARCGRVETATGRAIRVARAGQLELPMGGP